MSLPDINLIDNPNQITVDANELSIDEANFNQEAWKRSSTADFAREYRESIQ